MKLRLLLLLISLISDPAVAQVKVEWDAFERETVVSLKGNPAPGFPTFSALAVKETLARFPKGRVVWLDFMFTSQEWQYLKCHQLRFLADGVPVEVGESEHDGTVESGYVIEHVSVKVSLLELHQMVQAKQVMARVCGDVMPMSEATHKLLREFLLALTAESPLQLSPSGSTTEPPSKTP